MTEIELERRLDLGVFGVCRQRSQQVQAAT